jgi:hypothetical protein
MPIICPSLDTEDAHLSLVEHNTSYGGRAVFRCAWGYRLTAPPGIECEVDGQWSGPVPSCEGELYSSVAPTLHFTVDIFTGISATRNTNLPLYPEQPSDTAFFQYIHCPVGNKNECKTTNIVRQIGLQMTIKIITR